MGIDDPLIACKRFISTVLQSVKKINYITNGARDSLIVKSGEAERYFIVAVGKDRVDSRYAAIKTAFVADHPGRFDSDITLYEGEDALELRIPMSSIGENQRLRVTSERQDRSSDYPGTAATSPFNGMMPEVGNVVKHEELISYKNTQDTITFSVIGPKAKTWDKYKHRAFKGRDDGMQRAARPFNETLEYPGEALVSFSIQSIMTDWSAELDNFVQNPPAHNSSRWKNDDVYVCSTPAVMQMVGALPLDMAMSHHMLAKVLDENTILSNGLTTGQMYVKEKDMGKHHLSVDELRKLPLALANPVCIAVSNRKGCVEVITDMEENGVNVLVALHVGLKSTETPALIVSKIASAYGKNRIKTILDTHKILYWNDQKGKVMLNNYRLQLPQAIQHDLSTGNIWDFNDLVKYKQQNKFSFSLSGRGMIDAVDLGVMAREGQMQRLVSHARREAAPVGAHVCQGYAESRTRAQMVNIPRHGSRSA